MCGIAGFVGTGSSDGLASMLASIKHRGPDASGTFTEGKVNFAHARLAIIDTSDSAKQPMQLPDNSVSVTFNGEIYNFKELRKELESEGTTFATQSDTEVILHLYKKLGTAAFAKMEGQFALALYDFTSATLLLARDRMGEKPLYYSIQNGTLYFGSELKALLATGKIEKKINLTALNQYLQFDYVPAPLTILEGIYKVEPATVLTFTNGTASAQKFWHPPVTVKKITLQEAMSELDAELANTISQELIADVPLGVFLSGGIDSSTVAYYAQQHQTQTGGQAINTYSIGFDDASFDESMYAREAATHLDLRVQ